MKKLSIITLALLCANEALPHGYHHGGSGWGGFATGALIGTGVTLAATRGGRERSPEYYDAKERDRQRSEVRKQIRDHERELKHHEKEVRKLKRKADKAHKKGESSNEHEQLIAEHKKSTDEIKENISDLRAELRSI